jgi:hypothetical protein
VPLKPGKARGIISANIREMVASGRPQRVAVAAALRTADKSARAGHARPAVKKAAKR